MNTQKPKTKSFKEAIQFHEKLLDDLRSELEQLPAEKREQRIEELEQFARRAEIGGAGQIIK